MGMYFPNSAVCPLNGRVIVRDRKWRNSSRIIPIVSRRARSELFAERAVSPPPPLPLFEALTGKNNRKVDRTISGALHLLKLITIIAVARAIPILRHSECRAELLFRDDMEAICWRIQLRPAAAAVRSDARALLFPRLN